MTTANDVYKIAKAHLGHHGSHARAFCGLGKGQPYCCAFVRMCTSKAGGKKLFYGGKMVTYCPTAIKWCQANLAQVPPYLAMKMDFVFFDWQPNGTPDHIGFALGKISTDKIKTLEGNTSGGIVAIKEGKSARNTKYVQGIFRPHYIPDKKLSKCKLKIDGNFGYFSIYNLQLALKVKADGILKKSDVMMLQRKAGVAPDGSWGPKTSKGVQKLIGAKQDGEFGPASVKKLQEYANGINYPVVKNKKPTTTVKKPTTTVKKPVAKVTNQQKLINKMTELAWAYGTPKKKYAYKTGAPKAVCKKAMKKYGWADNKAEMSDCGNFLSTVVRESGVSKTFKALHGVKTPFPTSEKGFNIVLKGKAIPKGFLKPGDVIRYKKINGKQHAMFYFGDGKVCEASHYSVFGVIRKDTKRYNTQSKKKTIQVLRVKEK